MYNDAVNINNIINKHTLSLPKTAQSKYNLKKGYRQEDNVYNNFHATKRKSSCHVRRSKMRLASQKT